MNSGQFLKARHIDENSLFQESVRKFIHTEILPSVDAWEAAGYFPDEIFRKLGEQGYLGVLIPEQYGGVGGDYALAATWCEEFGRVPAVGFTVGVNMHSLVISHTVAKHAHEVMREQWLPAAVRGEMIGAYAFTEPGAGSDLASITTRAVRDGEGWILNGSKTFITNGKRADFALVLTKTDPGAARE